MMSRELTLYYTGLPICAWYLQAKQGSVPQLCHYHRFEIEVHWGEWPKAISHWIPLSVWRGDRVVLHVMQI